MNWCHSNMLCYSRVFLSWTRSPLAKTRRRPGQGQPLQKQRRALNQCHLPDLNSAADRSVSPRPRHDDWPHIVSPFAAFFFAAVKKQLRAQSVTNSNLKKLLRLRLALVTWIWNDLAEFRKGIFSKCLFSGFSSPCKFLCGSSAQSRLKYLHFAYPSH